MSFNQIIALSAVIALVMASRSCVQEKGRQNEKAEKEKANAPADAFIPANVRPKAPVPANEFRANAFAPVNGIGAIERMNNSFEKNRQEQFLRDVERREKDHEKNREIIELRKELNKLQADLGSEIRVISANKEREIKPLVLKKNDLDRQLWLNRRSSKRTTLMNKKADVELEIEMLKNDLQKEIDFKRIESNAKQDSLKEDIRKLNPFSCFY